MEQKISVIIKHIKLNNKLFMSFVLAHFGNVIRVCAQNNKLFMSFVLAHFGNVIRVCAQNNKLFMSFVHRAFWERDSCVCTKQ